MIKVENITKNYGTVKALKGISFEVQQGELYGLIGPDGSGKTTLFRILASLLLPASGKAFMNGFDTVNNYKSIRKMIGYMPEQFSLYLDLTVEENLKFFATVFNTTIQQNYYLIKDIYEALEPFKKRKARDLSGGMKQKLALSCALIHKPDILLLDEPTTGVDPVARRDFWDMLKTLQQTGITTLVSTPFMEDAELCDKVALVQNGALLTINTPGNIARNYPHQLLKIVTKDNYKTLTVLENFNEKISVFSFGNSVHLATGNAVSVSTVQHFLEQHHVDTVNIETIQAGIEDVFMELMK